MDKIIELNEKQKKIKNEYNKLEEKNYIIHYDIWSGREKLLKEETPEMLILVQKYEKIGDKLCKSILDYKYGRFLREKSLCNDIIGIIFEYLDDDIWMHHPDSKIS